MSQNKSDADTAEAREIMARVQDASVLLKQASAKITEIFWGQDEVVALSMACVLASGNFLAEGPPGAGKTFLVSNFASVMGLGYKRIQCTPDLMPGDITGGLVLNKVTGDLTFVEGPIFTNFVLMDEVNRASAKTQSAVLEAMGEKQVTVNGEKYAMEKPFIVAATQNPGYHVGTNPLPEAQKDRFMMRIDFDYPDEETEMRIAAAPLSHTTSMLDPVMSKEQFLGMQNLIDQMPIGDDLLRTCTQLVRKLRPGTKDASEHIASQIRQGPGTRAVTAFVRAAKGLAMIDGRMTPNMADISRLVLPILQHRVEMTNAHEEDTVLREVLGKVLKDIGLPPLSPKFT